MSWEEAAAIWVPELGMSFGQCCSALKKSWKAYRIASQKGYADNCLMLEDRINRLQRYMGLEEAVFGH
jgi:hypothetical protein